MVQKHTTYDYDADLTFYYPVLPSETTHYATQLFTDL